MALALCHDRRQTDPILSGLDAYWHWTGDAPLRSRVGGHPPAQGQGAYVSIGAVPDCTVRAALTFDGVSDCLVSPTGCEGRLNLGANGSNACTVFAWIERDVTTGAIIARCWQEDNGDPRRQYALFTVLDTYGGKDLVWGPLSSIGGPTPG